LRSAIHAREVAFASPAGSLRFFPRIRQLSICRQRFKLLSSMHAAKSCARWPAKRRLVETGSELESSQVRYSPAPGRNRNGALRLSLTSYSSASASSAWRASSSTIMPARRRQRSICRSSCSCSIGRVAIGCPLTTVQTSATRVAFLYPAGHAACKRNLTTGRT